MGYKHDTILFEEYAKARRKCKCGHSMNVTNRFKQVICTNCGNWLFKDEEKQIEYDKEMEKKKKLKEIWRTINEHNK